jgi:hypothetical protein
MVEMTSYLLIIGDRVALGWILTERRMAFPRGSRSEVRSLKEGDELFLYTTRGAFKNPHRDRGRVIGTAFVRDEVTPLAQPVHLGGRDYPVGCDLEIGRLAKLGSGVDLSRLVPGMETFADVGQAWSVRLRRPLLGLTKGDAARLQRELSKVLRRQDPEAETVTEYCKWFAESGSRSETFRQDVGSD